MQSVVFEPINNEIINRQIYNSEIDKPTSGYNSLRIFPDKKYPDDTTNHKTVRVKAVIGQPNVTVYFRNFDVDDPTDDPDIDENGSIGNDNREGRVIGQPYPPSAAGILATDSLLCQPTLNGVRCPTNANGEAVAYLTVTKQPGDNFVVAASTDDSYLTEVEINGTSLKDSTNNSLPTMKAKRTELLTVWRKVHLEVDSMGQVGNNLVNGYIGNSKGYIGQEPVWIDLYSGLGNLEAGRYRETLGPNGERISYGGRLTLGNIYDLQVLDNTANSVLVRSESGIVQIRPRQIFALFDDDDFNSNDGLSWRGDDGENVTYRGGSMFAETFSHL